MPLAPERARAAALSTTAHGSSLSKSATPGVRRWSLPFGTAIAIAVVIGVGFFFPRRERDAGAPIEQTRSALGAGAEPATSPGDALSLGVGAATPPENGALAPEAPSAVQPPAPSASEPSPTASGAAGVRPVLPDPAGSQGSPARPGATKRARAAAERTPTERALAERAPAARSDVRKAAPPKPTQPLDRLDAYDMP